MLFPDQYHPMMELESPSCAGLRDSSTEMRHLVFRDAHLHRARGTGKLFESFAKVWRMYPGQSLMTSIGIGM